MPTSTRNSRRRAQSSVDDEWDNEPLDKVARKTAAIVRRAARMAVQRQHEDDVDGVDRSE